MPLVRRIIMMTNAMGLSRSRAVLALTVAVTALAFATAGAQTTYTANMTGPQADPSNASPGTGTATVTVDPVSHTMHIVVNFSGLLYPTTVAHIHAPTALPGTGTVVPATTLPTLPGFPVGVTFGSYDTVLF